MYLNYAAPGRTVDEIERIFKIDDRVLRFLTVKLGDGMNAESIEAEIQRIAEKAAASAIALSEDTEVDEFDSEALEDESTEE